MRKKFCSSGMLKASHWKDKESKEWKDEQKIHKSFIYAVFPNKTSDTVDDFQTETVSGTFLANLRASTNILLF